jgi:TPR repeat protein
MQLRSAVALSASILCCVGLASCKKPKKSQPSPADSVISLGIEMAACDDEGFCQKRCDEGKADDCRRLAVAFQMGRAPIAKDEARATFLFEKGCALGSAMSCLSAGQMYEYEHGVARDSGKAAGYYEKACDAGFAPGCYNFAIMLENGRGVPRDLAKALANYDMACKAGSQTACGRAKELRDALPPDAGAPAR